MRFSKILVIFDEQQGVSLEVSFSDDSAKTSILVQPSSDEHSQDFYKGMGLALNSKQQAILVAQAILELAHKMEDHQ